MLGTVLDTRGGISSVVNVYKANGFFQKWSILYIATHCDGNAFKKIVIAVRGLILFATTLVGSKVRLVHVHVASRASFWRKSIFITCASLFRIPVIFHLHGGEFQVFYENECSVFKQAIIRNILNRCNCLIALSPQWQAWLRPLIMKPVVHSIYNPVQITHDRTTPAKRKTILFLGRLGKGKGIYDILNALVIVKQSYPDILLIAAGDGEITEVERHAGNLGLTKNIELPGWIGPKKASELRRKSWVYVLPSYHEGLPMSILEAMSAGLPVVSTPVGGIPEAVSDGVEGLLVKPGQVDQLAASIKCILDDDRLRERMARAAQDKIRTTFAAEVVLPKIEAIYREVGCQPVACGSPAGGR